MKNNINVVDENKGFHLDMFISKEAGDELLEIAFSCNLTRKDLIELLIKMAGESLNQKNIPNCNGLTANGECSRVD